MKKLFESMVFERLRQENPNFQSKVALIEGDLMADNMGLSDKDKNSITNNVDIIYHNAANVKFEIRASISLRSNVLGTKKMLDLARECKKLKLFIYVSTAYSHLYEKNIHEKYYPAPADLQTVYEVIEADEKTENGLLDEELQNVIGKFINIYPYSKAIAEDLVRQYAKDAKFAHAIFRPSIVTPSYKEPLAGWSGNLNGPIVFYLVAFLGLLRAVYYLNHAVDLIPCDLTVITRDTHIKCENKDRELVYNYGSSTTNPARLLKFFEYFDKIPLTERSSKSIALVSSMVTTRHLWLFYILHFLFHFIPVCLLDLGLLISGRKPQGISLFWKLTRHLNVIREFGNGNWKIHVSKTLEVVDKLNNADREIFYCDIRNLSWEEMVWITCRAMKLNILKEEISSEAARRRNIILYCIDYGLKAVFILACYYVLSTIFPMSIGI